MQVYESWALKISPNPDISFLRVDPEKCLWRGVGAVCICEKKIIIQASAFLSVN
jgi:hypothetical protein